MSLDQPHRRAPHMPSVYRREAVAIARSYNEQISHWQVRIAQLRSLATHSRDHKQRQQLMDEVASLDDRVTERRAALAKTVTTLPFEVATNSKLSDTKRAIDSVTMGLDGVKAILAADLDA